MNKLEQDRTGYVYFLMSKDHQRYKIGHTAYLMQRISEIDEQLDLTNSFYVSCDKHRRYQIEKVLHKELKNHRHWHNGMSEWFKSGSIGEALDLAEALPEFWSCVSQPTGIPEFSSLADIGAALAEAVGLPDADDSHDWLGSMALQIGDTTESQLIDQVQALLTATARLDLSCPYDAELADINESQANRLLDRLDYAPFMTADIRTMTRLYYTLNRPEFMPEAVVDDFEDVE